MARLSRLIVGLTVLMPVAIACQSSAQDLHSDTWVATDMLGRSLSVAPRPPRANRFVGIFYFLVHGTRAQHNDAKPPYDNASTILDNSTILQQLAGRLGPSFPQYMASYSRPGCYWWGQPAVGYFLSDDEWVHRKNLIMLADAGVDVILLDATNAVLYDAAEQSLFAAALELQRLGEPVPKIAYVTHTHVPRTVANIYSHFYATGRYKDLWFYWKGKPLILANVNDRQNDGQPIPAQLRNFFTWRDSWAWTTRAPRHSMWFGNGHDKWPWIDDYPQSFGWDGSPQQPEEMPVAVAGHPTDTLGRSYHGAFGAGGYEPPLNARRLTSSTGAGAYFSQQWQRALAVDPQFIFVTGWNEWYATRFRQPPPYAIANAGLHLPFYFVDEFNEEFSRDVMPMRGGFEDDYYMQLVEGIRRFKGARRVPTVRSLQSINVDAGFSQWADIQPSFSHVEGDTAWRDWPGWGKLIYSNHSGRNNIVLSKVAVTPQDVCFYARTAAPLSPANGPDWMQLLIDADENPRTGWHGYDFAVRKADAESPQQAEVDRWTGTEWERSGSAALRVAGNEMMLIVPRESIGFSPHKGVALDFHWIDNCPLDVDPADLWYRGENAPDGRFNYRYINTADGHITQPAAGPSPLAY